MGEGDEHNIHMPKPILRIPLLANLAIVDSIMLVCAGPGINLCKVPASLGIRHCRIRLAAPQRAGVRQDL